MQAMNHAFRYKLIIRQIFSWPESQGNDNQNKTGQDKGKTFNKTMCQLFTNENTFLVLYTQAFCINTTFT